MNDDARALLEQYRQDCEPSSEATASLHQRVTAAIAAPSPAAAGAGTGGSTLGLWVGGAALLLALGGAMLWASAGADAPPTPEPEAAVVAEAPEPKSEPEPLPTPEVAAPVIEAPPPTPVPEAETEAPTEPSRPARRTRKAAPTPAPSADTLAEETLLLRRAQQALSQGDAQQSLKLLAEHKQRFPRGLLVKERGSMRVIALCRADDPRAQKELSAYLRRHPATPYRDRLERACSDRSE